MAPTRILRFARTDDTSAFVLLQVTPKGSRALDLKLVGTEGEAPYTVSCKSSPLHHDAISDPGPQFAARTDVHSPASI